MGGANLLNSKSQLPYLQNREITFLSLMVGLGRMNTVTDTKDLHQAGSQGKEEELAVAGNFLFALLLLFQRLFYGLLVFQEN